MKISKQVWGSLTIILIIFLVACVDRSPNTTNGLTPSINLTDANRTAMPAAFTMVAQTMSAISSSTVVPTDSVLSPTPTIEIKPTSTPLPNFEPTEIPGLLKSALTVETLSSFKGHNLQRISGWKYGFHDFEWLDANHMILYPYAGVTNRVTDLEVAGTYPAVINLDSRQFWIPYLSEWVVDGRASFAWSAQLGVLIIPGTNNGVSTYDPDGSLINSYTGYLLGVSPSATKILIDGDTWVDLSSGKTVDFAWYQTGGAAEYAAHQEFSPIWSPDETRVYVCCYAYGDAKTGESFVMPYDAVTVDGQEVDYPLLAFDGTWVLNNKYMMPIWQGVWDSRFSTIFLFDPGTKTYRNLSKITGLPNYPEYSPEPFCNRPFAQNGGRYVWVTCNDGGHLIDLVTFHSQTYPPIDDVQFGWSAGSISDVEWSADGKFAKMSDIGRMISVTDQEWKPGSCGIWHPTENTLACLKNGGKTLAIQNAQTVSIQKEASLPIQFREIVWSTDGKYIALLADDNSLWIIDYPSLENLEQLTSAMPELTRQIPDYNRTVPLIKNLAWSPDSTSLAFIGSSDIYIINTGRTP